MASLTLTTQQIIELVRQLSLSEQAEILTELLRQPWSKWQELANYGQDKIRSLAAQHGKNWETMTDSEKEDFINEVLYAN